MRKVIFPVQDVWSCGGGALYRLGCDVVSLVFRVGAEEFSHAAFTLATTVEVYFAHPHSPWGRGTNENTNGLLREYFPKGTEITEDSTSSPTSSTTDHGVSSATEPQQKPSSTS
jgi:hypothetical protein